MNIKARVELDVHQGPDSDEKVAQDLTLGLGEEDLLNMRVERTDKVSGNGHPIWLVEGHPAQVVFVCLRYNGIPHDEIKTMIEEIERFEYVEVFDPDHVGGWSSKTD